MELRQLRYALSVAKERSFTRAAKGLNVSQSAVSEQVALLEGDIGFPLFRRTPRGIEVTERGRSFLYEAERVIGDVLSLTDSARRLRGWKSSPRRRATSSASCTKSASTPELPLNPIPTACRPASSSTA